MSPGLNNRVNPMKIPTCPTGLEKYLKFQNTTTDRRKVALVLSCLKGEAHHRFETFVHLGLGWEEFRPRLLTYFDDDATRRRITLSFLRTA